MGAPKQKWTPEEEAALKAGVLKHGTGKWRTILSDPEYSSILRIRSNVDLKDKWRNISVTALWGSRKKAKLAKRTASSGPNQDDNTTLLNIAPPANNDGGGEIDPLSLPGSSSEPPPELTREDKMILETITKLKKPFGPDGKSIVLYMKENYKVPDAKRLVTSRLKYLTAVGTLIKKKHKYKISPDYMAAQEANQTAPQLMLEGDKENSSPKPVEKPVENGEVFTIQGMTLEEAAAAAAKAVAEAEFAIAEAAEASRAADEAEAKAEAAEIFATAVIESLNLKYRLNL